MDIDSDAWRQFLIDGAAHLGIRVSPDQAAAMGCHAREMLQWNRVSNLTTIVDPAAVAIKHDVDCLVLANFLEKDKTVVDAGSGAGFPGIPLKILRPDLCVTMVDSVRKKVSFLNYIIGMLNLSDIRAVHGRLEALGKMADYRMRFDHVVCRAFSSLETFAELGLSFLKPGGTLLALKGPQASRDAEMGDHTPGTGTLKDGEIVKFSNQSVHIRMHAYELPFSEGQRTLVQLTPVGEGMDV